MFGLQPSILEQPGKWQPAFSYQKMFVQFFQIAHFDTTSFKMWIPFESKNLFIFIFQIRNKSAAAECQGPENDLDDPSGLPELPGLHNPWNSSQHFGKN
jgi:hypothetical protein